MKRYMGKLFKRNEGSKPLGASLNSELPTNDTLGVSSGGWPVEIQRAEIQDWWESERKRILQDLPKRLPGLIFLVDQKIENMSFFDLMRKRKQYRADEIDPIVIDWLEDHYKEFSRKLESSFAKLESSFKSYTSNIESKNLDKLSYQDYLLAGSSIAVTVAPLGALPFVAGGLVTSGFTLLGFTIGGGVLIPSALYALLFGVGCLAIAPGCRAWAVRKIKKLYKDNLRKELEWRVLGDHRKPGTKSLMGTLLSDLEKVARARMEAAK